MDTMIYSLSDRVRKVAVGTAAASLAIALVVTSADTSADCLYQPHGIKTPLDAVAQTNNAPTTSYLLKGGAYAYVVDWHCERVGKRILLVMPIEQDDVARVAEILRDFLETEDLDFYAAAILGSRNKTSFRREIKRQGFEFSEVSVRRTDYEAEYVVLFSTPD